MLTYYRRTDLAYKSFQDILFLLTACNRILSTETLLAWQATYKLSFFDWQCTVVQKNKNLTKLISDIKTIDWIIFSWIGLWPHKRYCFHNFEIFSGTFIFSKTLCKENSSYADRLMHFETVKKKLWCLITSLEVTRQQCVNNF